MEFMNILSILLHGLFILSVPALFFLAIMQAGGPNVPKSFAYGLFSTLFLHLGTVGYSLFRAWKFRVMSDYKSTLAASLWPLVSIGFIVGFFIVSSRIFKKEESRQNEEFLNEATTFTRADGMILNVAPELQNGFYPVYIRNEQGGGLVGKASEKAEFFYEPRATLALSPLPDAAAAVTYFEGFKNRQGQGFLEAYKLVHPVKS